MTFSLIKNEMKRTSFIEFVIILVVANFAAFFLATSTASLTNTTNSMMDASASSALSTVDLSIMLLRAILIVWEAVLISQIVINEYHTKTINMLFSYHYSRGKIIAVKIALISMILLVAHSVSLIAQHLIMYFYQSFNSAVVFTMINPGQQIVTMISTIFIGFIPLFFGIQFRSNISTIVSSIVIVVMVSNSQGGNAGLISIPTVAVILGTVGLVLLIIAIKRMLTEDL